MVKEKVFQSQIRSLEQKVLDMETYSRRENLFFFFFFFFLLYTNDMVIDNSQRHNYMTLQQNIHKTKTHSGIH